MLDAITSTIEKLVCAGTVAEIMEAITGARACTESGHALMTDLLRTRPDVANEVLCTLYDVAVFKVGDTCFRDSSSTEEQDKWFVSTLVGGEIQSSGEIPLADGMTAALRLAVEHLGLVGHFFGRREEVADACR